MPIKRISPVWVNFGIAVIIFAIMNLILSIDMEWIQFLLSLICWKSIGNSNWYIFVILACYVATYIVHKILYHYNIKNQIMNCVTCFIAIILIMLLLSIYKPAYWYNTILCFPAGMLFSCYKNQIDLLLRKNRNYIFLFAALLCIFFLLKKSNFNLHGLAFNIQAIAFAMMIVLLTMKMKINNPFLKWCGKNLFPFYIYQRIPMIILARYLGASFMFDYPLFFMITALIISLGIVVVYPKWEFHPAKVSR